MEKIIIRDTNKMAETLVGVHTHTHTHTQVLLIIEEFAYITGDYNRINESKKKST